jgi:hypothetical protein
MPISSVLKYGLLGFRRNVSVLANEVLVGSRKKYAAATPNLEPEVCRM